MTETNNALRLADELEIPIEGYPEATELERNAAAELRRLHAYCQELEAQVIRDCMTHVQNPAENEHVAGNVLKNGAEVNMNVYAELPEPDATTVGLGAVWNRHSMRDFADATHALRASSAQAPAGDWLWCKLMDFCKKRGFAPANFNDLFEIVAAARAAPQPSPTAQAAESVPAPAPAPDERDDFEKVFPLPSGCVRVGTGYASTGYSNWAAHTHCERWQGWQARAARDPAGSVLEDAMDDDSLDPAVDAARKQGENDD